MAARPSANASAEWQACQNAGRLPLLQQPVSGSRDASAVAADAQQAAAARWTKVVGLHAPCVMPPEQRTELRVRRYQRL